MTAFTDLLIHLCDITRYTSSGPDSYGQYTKTWNAHLSNVACRLTNPSNNEIETPLEGVVADQKLFMADLDVTEKDRVTSGGIAYEILSVASFPGELNIHKELLMKRVK